MLPFWYRPLGEAAVDPLRFPYHAVTQRPAAMYHSWGSQNTWLRQIAARNFLYLHPDTAAAHGIAIAMQPESTTPGRTAAANPVAR